MGLVQLILFIAVIGFCFFLLQTYVPMPPIAKTIMIFVVVMAIIILLLQFFGVATGMRMHL